MFSTLVLVVISVLVSVIQRSPYQFLDPLFALCIVHLPALFSLLVLTQLKD